MLRRCGVIILAGALLAFAGILGQAWNQANAQQHRAAGLEKVRTLAEEVKEKGSAGTESGLAFEWQLPNEGLKMPFKDIQPIYFLTRNQGPAEWDKLPGFWNSFTEKVPNPISGQPVERKAVKIKVPLGLTSAPPIPPENPMTVQKWTLGKKLFFDNILSSDHTVSCATCHDPKKGFTDNSPFSTGIRGSRGGMSAPTVFNSAYQTFQFWDGRASSLEDQAQGPVQNALEMFDGDGHAWRRAVERIRKDADLVKQFRLVFGTEPTRDTVAKALATYERTVLSGNSIHDRAELAMRTRVDEEETGKYELQAKDYAKVLTAAISAKDTPALTALKFDPNKAKVEDLARSLVNGRNLFFNKARCNGCHIGDNFTDNQFHNLGVGVKPDGRILPTALGRYGSQPTGHKNPELAGAFKTPTLRHLVGTGPFMHDGSEKTLEEVVNFYDRGGNVNEYLDGKMRDFDTEAAYLRALAEKKPYKGPEVRLLNGKPVVPLKLNLSDVEKKDLVLFLRALQGDPANPILADKDYFPR